MNNSEATIRDAIAKAAAAHSGMSGYKPDAQDLKRAALAVAAFLDAMNGKNRQAGYNLARCVEETFVDG